MIPKIKKGEIDIIGKHKIAGMSLLNIQKLDFFCYSNNLIIIGSKFN